MRVREDYDAQTVQAIMMIEVVANRPTRSFAAARPAGDRVAAHHERQLGPLVATIRAASLADFDRVLREARMIDGVSNSETSLLLSST